jgi:hypothetical protein
MPLKGSNFHASAGVAFVDRAFSRSIGLFEFPAGSVLKPADHRPIAMQPTTEFRQRSRAIDDGSRDCVALFMRRRTTFLEPACGCSAATTESPAVSLRR